MRAAHACAEKPAAQVPSSPAAAAGNIAALMAAGVEAAKKALNSIQI